MAYSELISIGVTVVACLVPGVWAISLRMARLEARINTGLMEVQGKLGEIDKDLGYVKDELATARSARGELWKEVNMLREKTTRMSTIIKLPER